MFHVEHQIRSLIFELAVSNEIAASLFSPTPSAASSFTVTRALPQADFRHCLHLMTRCSTWNTVLPFVSYQNGSWKPMSICTQWPTIIPRQIKRLLIQKALRCLDALTVDLRKQVGWISPPCFTWNNGVLKCSCRDTSPGQTATASCRPATHQLSGDSNSSRLMSLSKLPVCFKV